MPEVPETCYWLEDRCDRPAVGSTAHPIHGVIPICAQCAANSGAPLIAIPRKAS